MSEYLHLAARAHHAPMPITAHEIASWLWPHLRETFPRALAAVLMPDHLHVVIHAADPAKARIDLARVLGNCARGRGPVSEIGWVPSGTPSAFSGADKLARNVRYVALNPVRACLVDDPLSWLWSTHRDVQGGVGDPWVTPERLGRALGWTASRVTRDWHAYVSLDAGRAPSPRAVPFSHRPDLPDGEVPLSWVAAAAVAATRGRSEHVRERGETRTLFLALARAAGWHWPSVVAGRCGVTARAVQRAWRLPPPDSLAAGLLCLGDARLRESAGRELRGSSSSRADREGMSGRTSRFAT